jgi:propionate CoA-transferase
MTKVVSAEDAARLVESGQTVSVCGVVGALCPEKILAALERRFLETGQPRDLTLVFPVAVGDVWDLPGMDHLANEGMLRRMIGGSYVIGTNPKTGRRARGTEMVLENRVEAYNFPIGALLHLQREIAGGRPGLVTPIGLDTFVDPRWGGGKLNERTSEDLVELVELDGREYLWYRAFPIHAAIIRATTADEAGNLTMEHEGTFSGVLAQAMAAHNSGGKVIAQVKRLTRRGTLQAQMVQVPGNLVDFVVVDPEQVQATGIRFDPAVCGETRVPLETVRLDVPLDANTVIARRALRELRSGETVILGFGAPALMPQIALAEGLLDQLTFTIEHGAVGGVPLGGFQFGSSANPEAIIDSAAHFDYIGGAGFDAACLAFAEVDYEGNVNVSKLPGLIPGCGGFIDITHNARRIVYCGTFTTGGLEAEIGQGRVRIAREGKHTKFVDQLHHRTYSARRGLERGQHVSFVTERAVFELTSDGLLLAELAEGIDLERGVLAAMKFRPRIAEPVRPMEAGLFQLAPIGLRLRVG